MVKFILEYFYAIVNGTVFFISFSDGSLLTHKCNWLLHAEFASWNFIEFSSFNGISVESLRFYFLFLATCRILIPQPEIKPIPLAVKARSPNHWMAREFLRVSCIKIMSSVETILLLPFWFGFFYLFLLPNSLASTSNTMLKRSGGNRHPLSSSWP